ncbi:sensor histidine kinase [Actinocorallia populi]|uniref:sensor histidine kinase n=1 Tax=Actinocorallia populi TaxID=2079200 RepID=UPI000D090A5C|nr:histidine kinase [Actinocorallia populi]
MNASSLRRLPPGTWTALAWSAAMAYETAISVRLPGEVPRFRPEGLGHLSSGDAPFVVAATVLVLGGALLLGRRPLPALALFLAGSVFTAMALNSTEITFPQFLAAGIALGRIAATRSRRTSIIAVAMALAVLVGHSAIRLMLGFPIGTSTQSSVALSAVIAWLAGGWIRQSRDHARMAHVQAVTAERLRIARELHDSVAHSIGVIAIQAGAAKMVIDTRPAAAREALGTIEHASRETLAGLRRMLGALRQADTVPDSPAPGLADLERLAVTTEAAGVRVDVRRRGRRDPLPAEIDLSAFRIVQEAVTNVVRHAGARSCRVSIEQRDDELAIEVVDSGRGGTGLGGGHGIVGMRERVGLLHGDFTAGPRPEGGFRVAARLPVRSR